MRKVTYGNSKEILKFPDHHISRAVTLDDEGVTADANGRKIIPAGTIIGGGFLADPDTYAVKANNANAEGVLRYDVDVTFGPMVGAAVIHGFVDLEKLPEAPTEDAVKALTQITFLK